MKVKQKTTLLSKHSVLRRFPSVNPKQTLFLDGMRHAIEIAELAYSNLMDNLKTISKAVVGEEKDRSFIKRSYISAHASAWTFVDVVDRYRGLLLQTDNIFGKDIFLDDFKSICESVRNLRGLRLRGRWFRKCFTLDRFNSPSIELSLCHANPD